MTYAPISRPIVPEDIRQPSALAVLSWLCRAQAMTRKVGRAEAANWLAAHRAPEKAQTIFKAGIAAGSTSDSTLGAEGTVVGDFSMSMRTASSFFRILSDNSFTR